MIFFFINIIFLFEDLMSLLMEMAILALFHFYNISKVIEDDNEHDKIFFLSLDKFCKKGLQSQYLKGFIK